jgi:hypothetical protein
MEKVFPIRSGGVYSAATNRHIDNVGLDIAINAVHDQMNSLICFPPLAVSRNDLAQSTVGNHQRRRQRGFSSFIIA